MGKKLGLLGISEKEDIFDVQDKVCGRLMKWLGDDCRKAFKCSLDETRLYEFQWKDNDGHGFFAAFVDPQGIDSFVRENKTYAEWLGFDPLDPGGYEVETKVYVYSPNSFPKKELSSLLLTKADIVLVTTDEIIEEYDSSFSSEK